MQEAAGHPELVVMVSWTRLCAAQCSSARRGPAASAPPRPSGAAMQPANIFPGSLHRLAPRRSRQPPAAIFAVFFVTLICSRESELIRSWRWWTGRLTNQAIQPALHSVLSNRFLNVSSKSGSRRFQPGEGPSRGFFRDYDPLCGPLFLALVNTEQDTGLLSSDRERECSA